MCDLREPLAKPHLGTLQERIQKPEFRSQNSPRHLRRKTCRIRHSEFCLLTSGSCACKTWFCNRLKSLACPKATLTRLPLLVHPYSLPLLGYTYSSTLNRRPPSSVLRPQSSVLRPPPSVFRLPSSALSLPSSVFRPPPSVLRPLTSVLSRSAQTSPFASLSASANAMVKGMPSR